MVGLGANSYKVWLRTPHDKYQNLLNGDFKEHHMQQIEGIFC